VSESFQAAVLRRRGGPIAVEEVELDPLRPSDVLVRIGASGICHSDLEVFNGDLALPMPIVLGHEGAGVVVAVGSAVETVSPGDHVIGSWNPSCGRCFYCLRDQPILCERCGATSGRGLLSDGTTRLRINGDSLHHFSFVASHAEFAVMHESSVVPMPPEVPFDNACLLGCAVATGFCAPLRVARVAPGSCVAIVGCGAVGLNVVQGARVAGASEIIAIDIDERRLDLARHLGATFVVDPSAQDAISEVRRTSDSRGADYVFEAAGSEAGMRLALETARPGAEIVLLGKVPFDSDVSFRFGSLFGEKRVVRSSYGGTRPARDFPMMIDYFLRGELKLDELITQRLALEEIGEGFGMMTRHEALRAVIVFQ
jgi:S-(hydroxymethyl)glutathione dehydrogenase / alcohol dehydrogenase